MKRFKIEDNRWDAKPDLYVILYNPPYENENILHKTGLKEKDCIITDLSKENTIDLNDFDSIDNEHDEKENSLMGKKSPKKPKEKK